MHDAISRSKKKFSFKSVWFGKFESWLCSMLITFIQEACSFNSLVFWTLKMFINLCVRKLMEDSWKTLSSLLFFCWTYLLEDWGLLLPTNRWFSPLGVSVNGNIEETPDWVSADDTRRPRSNEFGCYISSRGRNNFWELCEVNFEFCDWFRSDLNHNTLIWVYCVGAGIF